jgi:hypothetical protein
MQSALIRSSYKSLLSAVLFVWICGCANNNQALELRQQLIDLEARQNLKVQELQHQLDRERTARELDIRRVASRVECHNDRVREFLKECEQGSEVCSEHGVANAFQFMITQPYVQIYLRPHAGTKGIVATRRGQLVTMGDPKNWLPSTRFLVLIQPRNDSAEQRDEAMRVGREVQRYIHHLFAEEKALPIIGPKILPCKLKTEEVSHRVGKFDVPVKGEPKGDEPSVRVWVFRTDC